MAVTPSAPGTLRTTTVGEPGRYFPRKAATNRPYASVPPPAAKPMIIVMVLPSKELGSCAGTPKHPMRKANRPTPIVLIAYPSSTTPHATLASRRPATTLPGLDLHQLIAPALAGAFSFDYLIGAR